MLRVLVCGCLERMWWRSLTEKSCKQLLHSSLGTPPHRRWGSSFNLPLEFPGYESCGFVNRVISSGMMGGSQRKRVYENEYEFGTGGDGNGAEAQGAAREARVHQARAAEQAPDGKVVQAEDR